MKATTVSFRSVTPNMTYFLPSPISLLLASCVLAVSFGSVRCGNSKCDDLPTCGSAVSDDNLIDLTEPSNPGPFHDLTQVEIRALRTFLENDPKIQARKPKDIALNGSFVHMVDLYIPRKSDVRMFLNGSGDQPLRQARVMMFRGDLSPPVIQEYICGPLPKVQSCELMKHKYRRNPVQFSVRPLSKLEYDGLHTTVDVIFWKVSLLLKESYNITNVRSLTESELNYGYIPVGTGIIGNINERKVWLMLTWDLPFFEFHHLDFGLLLSIASPNITDWTIDQVWYAGRLYKTLEELDAKYKANTIPKVTVNKSTQKEEEMFSTLHRRGNPMPKYPQRAPLNVEPDGKRYTIRNRKVEYMEWSFFFRMSSFTGPVLYDIRFKNETIVYELGLGEITVFYSGSAPSPQVTNYVDSTLFVGLHSRALVPGADCPEFSTFVNQTFLSTFQESVDLIDSCFCVFELNNGMPLRTHRTEGNGYEGMLDLSLTIRSALTIDNYDYIVDFIFHQNGAVETRFLSTGYILASFYRQSDSQYGFRLAENVNGNVHHHMAHFKLDMDILGTSNRFETMEVVSQEIQDPKNSNEKFTTMRLRRELKRTELEAVYDYDFDRPTYLLVHNGKYRRENNGIQGYRLQTSSVSKQYVPEGAGNERTISWARHQVVVTKRKDDEFSSSSNYAMFDGADPVVDFSNFYKDDDNIVDEDLVLWITCGMHHIPHTEDIPVTPSVGNHLSFFLLPYNYFPSTPSMNSRDTVRGGHKNMNYPKREALMDQGTTPRDQYRAPWGQCLTPPITLEEDVEKNPDLVLQTLRPDYVNG